MIAKRLLGGCAGPLFGVRCAGGDQFRLTAHVSARACYLAKQASSVRVILSPLTSAWRGPSILARRMRWEPGLSLVQLDYGVQLTRFYRCSNRGDNDQHSKRS